jgi:hypothetical protein
MKADENDVFDEKRLLNSVPPKFKTQAKILLNNFDQRGNELTWNSNGVIFIDQVALPQSNIYEIFPLLFRSKKSVKRIPGLLETLNKIEIMGLSSYIKKHGNGSKSGSGSGLPAQTLVKATNWWYLGP